MKEFLRAGADIVLSKPLRSKCLRTFITFCEHFRHTSVPEKKLTYEDDQVVEYVMRKQSVDRSPFRRSLHI